MTTIRRNRARWVTWTPSEVKRLRSFLGWSQLRFADEIGSTWHTISGWERGRTAVTGIASASLTTLANAHGFFTMPAITPDPPQNYPNREPALLRVSEPR